MKKTMRILFGLTTVVAVVVAVLGILGIVDMESVLGAGAVMAAAPVGFVGATAAETKVGSAPTVDGKPVTTGKSGVSPEDKPQMNKASVSEKLARIEPSRTPLDTLLRNIGSGKTKSDQFEFYSIHSRGLSATVSSATVASGASVITVVLTDGCHCLSKDANVFVPELQVNGTAIAAAAPLATNPLRLHIVDINYGESTIKVVPLNEGITPATAQGKLASGVVLRRMASSKDQEAAISNDPMATPVKDVNYCQRNLCTISQNAYQALQEKEVEYGIAEFKEQALLDFRAQAEYAAIFGVAPAGGSIVDPTTQKRKLFMRGLLSFDIMKYVQTSESIEEYINIAMQRAFENNNGSEKRLLLYGPEFATAMANSKVWAHQLEAGKTEVKWGITWKVIESNFGTLLAIMHPGLGAVGYGKAAILIDPANIRRIEQVPLTMENLDLKKAGIRNSEDVLLEESFTLEVTNPKTHGFLCLA